MRSSRLSALIGLALILCVGGPAEAAKRSRKKPKPAPKTEPAAAAPVASSTGPLVGPSVGSADVFLSEGNRLYNTQEYGKASESFLLVTRANPALASAYLSLARSSLSAKQLARACYAYRAYLRADPDSADRTKAESELTLCERQLKADPATKEPDFGAKFTEVKARFFTSLEKGALLGSGSAGEALTGLVVGGYLGTDLADMARKLNEASLAVAEETYRAALSGKERSSKVLRQALPLYDLAARTGPPPPRRESHAAFLEGLAELLDGHFHQADDLFARASHAEPGIPEYLVLRARAIDRGGDRQRAVQLLDADLPKDPRTGVLHVASALGKSSQAGAVELERVLFQQRFPESK